jgi:ABC-type antimicrobial peptide transport system permease subunit
MTLIATAAAEDGLETPARPGLQDPGPPLGAGLYGVMSFTLRARRKEMGIRRTLGAGRASVVGLGLRRSLRLTALGLLIGAVLCALAGAGLGATIAGIQPWDPVVIAAVALFVLAVGSGATLPASVSAARVDPLTALRSEA